MKRIKPFMGCCLQAPKISHILDFKSFINIEDVVLKDLKDSISDIDELTEKQKE